MNGVKGRAVRWLTLLAFTSLALAPSANSAVEESIGDFNAYTIKKGKDFSTLEDWVADNYTTHVDLSTLFSFNEGDFRGVTFRTGGKGGRDSHLLLDSGENLVLLTTANLTVTDPEITEEQALEKAGKAGVRTSPLASTADPCNTPTNRCNCVLYARCRVPKLPFGMTTYSDKVSKINSYTPSVGSVAIMNTYPPYGHVAVVTAVKLDASKKVVSVSVIEANYQRCQVSSRTGSPATMKITGYFKP